MNKLNKEINMVVKTKTVKDEQKMPKIEKSPTEMAHCFLIDWNDNGLLKEIAVVMEAPDGSIYGIEIDRLHPIDKSRLKKFLVSQHADKYALWELLSQGKLSNGLNALDYFHCNAVKVKRPRGAIIGGSISSVGVYSDDSVIGAKFSDPRSATIHSETPEMGADFA